jgi:mRNA interferase HicA
VKRRRFLRYLRQEKCQIVEGARHTRVFNPASDKWSAVPRHTEIDTFLMRKICKQLEIPVPKEV